MNEMQNPYVEERDGVLYITGNRAPLESLVWLWRDGHSAETIQEAYSTLTLAEVYGAIAYYLDHQPEVDQRLQESIATYAAQQAAAEAANPARYAALRQRMAAARAQHMTTQPAS